MVGLDTVDVDMLPPMWTGVDILEVGVDSTGSGIACEVFGFELRMLSLKVVNDCDIELAVVTFWWTD